MPRISFVKTYPDIDVKEGTLLMKALLEHNIPVASSCHGDAVCGKCALQILKGEENLSPITEQEEILKDQQGVDPKLRISCLAQVAGDIEIDADYW